MTERYTGNGPKPFETLSGTTPETRYRVLETLPREPVAWYIKFCADSTRLEDVLSGPPNERRYTTGETPYGKAAQLAETAEKLGVIPFTFMRLVQREQEGWEIAEQSPLTPLELRSCPADDHFQKDAREVLRKAAWQGFMAGRGQNTISFSTRQLWGYPGFIEKSMPQIRARGYKIQEANLFLRSVEYLTERYDQAIEMETGIRINKDGGVSLFVGPSVPTEERKVLKDWLVQIGK
jgi:hypothetical protein